MIKTFILAIMMVCFGFTAGASAAPATADEALAAITKATEAEAAAAKIRNQWSSTEVELKAARAALDAKSVDEALAHARLAEAMARQSILQAQEQNTSWREGVPK